jgi:hypothetical protein
MKLKIFFLITAMLALGACNTVENGSTSASMLQIVSLTGKDLEGTEGSLTVFSDVETNGSIINDNGVAEIKVLPLDPLILTTTPYMDVLIDQIDVSFKRTDGRNVEGVDVPYSFTQPVSMLATIDGTATVPFILIRHTAKLDAPLFALRQLSQGKVLQLVAVVTIHGKDQGGHRVKPVAGNISVWCSNFSDSTSTSTSVFGRE